MAGPKTGTNGRHPLPSIEALGTTLGRLGISSGTLAPSHPRTLKSLSTIRIRACMRAACGGCSDMRAMMPLRCSTADGRSGCTRDGQHAAGSRPGSPEAFVPAPRHEMRVGVDEVVCTPPRLGDAARGRPRAGAIRRPNRADRSRARTHSRCGQSSLQVERTATTATLLPPDVLRDRFTTLLDGRDPSQAVMYCGSGVTACHNLLAMTHAGLPGARLYAGSWSEWSADPARPVEKGPTPTSTRRRLLPSKRAGGTYDSRDLCDRRAADGDGRRSTRSAKPRSGPELRSLSGRMVSPGSPRGLLRGSRGDADQPQHRGPRRPGQRRRRSCEDGIVPTCRCAPESPCGTRVRAPLRASPSRFRSRRTAAGFGPMVHAIGAEAVLATGTTTGTGRWPTSCRCRGRRISGSTRPTAVSPSKTYAAASTRTR